MKNISRRTATKTVLAGSAAMAVSGMEAAAPAKKKKVEKITTHIHKCDAYLSH